MQQAADSLSWVLHLTTHGTVSYSLTDMHFTCYVAFLYVSTWEPCPRNGQGEALAFALQVALYKTNTEAVMFVS